MRAFLSALLRDEEGSAIVEYAIIAAVLAVPLLAVGYSIQQNASSSISTTTTGLQQWGVNPP